jgi:hypothetical protein
MRGVGIALALGLGLCHSKVVCSSAKASGLPVQIAEPPSEKTLLAKSRGNKLASPERQSLLAKGRTSVDALASADSSAVAKARNLLSRQSNSDQVQGTSLLQKGSRRPKGTLLLKDREMPRRLIAEAFQDSPTWRDLPEEERVQEQVEEEEVKPPQVPFTPCVDPNGELQAFYGEDWQPQNQEQCREHCENFGSQACVGYSFHMTYGCKLFSPAKWQRGSKAKSKSIAIAGIVSCAASVSASS